HQTHNPARLSPARAKEFLRELANLRDDSFERFRRRFSDCLPRLATHAKSDSLKDGLNEWEQLYMLRARLRFIWQWHESRTREYALFLLQKKALEMEYPHLNFSDDLFTIPPPSPSGFEQTLIYFRKRADLARYCENSECPAPFFFAERRS